MEEEVVGPRGRGAGPERALRGPFTTPGIVDVHPRGGLRHLEVACPGQHEVEDGEMRVGTAGPAESPCVIPLASFLPRPRTPPRRIDIGREAHNDEQARAPRAGKHVAHVVRTLTQYVPLRVAGN